jgi:hypothetical protein
VGANPGASERITASSPLLVHFLDFAQLNSVRSLPYVLAWAERYGPHGLVTVGVHTPRFPFGRDPGAVAGGLEHLGVAHPVVLDPDAELWRDYGCRGWPSFFLWGRGGPLRWYHLGEGEYEPTELALREEMEDGEDGADWPPPLEPIRASDRQGAEVVVPTEELFPGGAPETPWRAGDSPDGALAIAYAAGGAYATVSGGGTLSVSLDGAPPTRLEVAGPGLVELVVHDRHEEHALSLEPDPGLAVHSVSFAPGVP